MLSLLTAWYAHGCVWIFAPWHEDFRWIKQGICLRVDVDCKQWGCEAEWSVELAAWEVQVGWSTFDILTSDPGAVF